MQDKTTSAHEFTPPLDDELFSAALDEKLEQGMEPVHALDETRKELDLDRLQLVQALNGSRFRLSARGKVAAQLYLADIRDEIEGS